MQFVRSSVFAYFNGSECGQRSVAVTVNPSQVDFFPPMTFSGIAFVSTPEAAKFALGRSVTTVGKCASGNCDGYDFVMVTDDDGSLTGIANS